MVCQRIERTYRRIMHVLCHIGIDNGRFHPYFFTDSLLIRTMTDGTGAIQLDGILTFVEDKEVHAN